jgi:hypothetical protein
MVFGTEDRWRTVILLNLCMGLLLLSSCAGIPASTKYVGPVIETKSPELNQSSFEALWEKWTIRLVGTSGGGGPLSSGSILSLSGGGSRGGGEGEFPIQITATLMDSSLIEAGLQHYADVLKMSPEEQRAYRTSYFQRYGVENHLLIWADLSTSQTELFLDLQRWIIYIEDDAGNQHELQKAIEEPEPSPPETTEAFPDLPPQREFRRRVFHQERLMLCFPQRDFAGNPVLSAEVRSLKLVFQQNDDPQVKAEGIWVFRK